MSAQWRNFGAQGAWITENELSETVWDFTFRLLASFQKVDFFSAEEVRPSGSQNFRLKLFLLTLLWGQRLSSFRIVPLCGTQIISFSATATNVTVSFCSWFWDVRTRAVGLVKSLFLFGHQRIILSRKYSTWVNLKDHRQALKPARFSQQKLRLDLGRPGTFFLRSSLHLRSWLTSIRFASRSPSFHFLSLRPFGMCLLDRPLYCLGHGLELDVPCKL